MLVKVAYRHGAAVGEERKINRDWLKRAQAISARSTVDIDVVLDPTRAEGSTLYDVDGNAYLDFGVSVGTNNFGFGSFLHAIRQARYEVSRMPTMHSHGIYNAYGIAAQELLAQRTLLRDVTAPKKVFMVNSGAEANETAIKMLLRRRPDRPCFITFEGAFHGRSLGPLSLIDRRKTVRIKGFPLPVEVIILPYPASTLSDASDVMKKALSRFTEKELKRCNGIFLEFVQGEGGIYPADPGAVRLLADVAETYDIQIIADEVQAGMGRTGTLWSYYQYGALPDIVTMGKSLCGGLPVGAVVTTQHWDFPENGAQASTFGAEPDRAAALLAAFQLLNEKKLCSRARLIGRTLNAELLRIADSTSLIRNVRGLGAMYGVEFTSSVVRDKVKERAKTLGLLLESAGIPELNPTLRFMPPLVVSDDDLTLGLAIFQRALRDAYPQFQRT